MWALRVRPLTAKGVRVLLTTIDFPNFAADPLPPPSPAHTHISHYHIYDLLAFTRRARARRRDGSTIFFPIFIPWKPQQDSHSTVRGNTGFSQDPATRYTACEEWLEVCGAVRVSLLLLLARGEA